MLPTLLAAAALAVHAAPKAVVRAPAAAPMLPATAVLATAAPLAAPGLPPALGPAPAAPVGAPAAAPALAVPAALAVSPAFAAPPAEPAAAPAQAARARPASPALPPRPARLAAPASASPRWHARALDASRPALPSLELPGADELRRASPESLKARALDFFAQPAARASDAEPRPAHGAVDDTAGLKRFRRQAEEGSRPLPRAAREHAYLLVPGLLWDVVDGYFEPNLRRLRELGLPARVVETDPLGGTADNAERIAAAVRATARPVVILAHSKAALDALEALERHPDVAAKVKRLVAIQAPYFGAALADWVVWRGWLRDAALTFGRLLLAPRRILKTMPLSRDEALRPLTKQARRDIGPRRPGPASTGLFSVATRIGAGTRAPWASRLTSGLVRLVSGSDNDGLVEARDQVLPGSRYALLDHVSHVDTVSEPGAWKQDAFGVRGHEPRFAEDLTEGIVRWIFARRELPQTR